MTADRWLSTAVKKLEQARVGTARLDALVLLEYVSGQDRSWLLAHEDTEIESGQLTELDKLLTRRLRHEPMAYTLGRSEFYGRSFEINSSVLEPRPESEAMIDLLKGLPCFSDNAAKQSSIAPKIRIADVGTGSGALGITAQLELPNSTVELIEIDPEAIKTAQTNVDKFTLSISVIQSDLLTDTPQNYDILLCNLPYVPDGYTINDAAMHEPKIAIFGGPDGLDIYRQLFSQLPSIKKQPLFLLLEALPVQHKELQKLAAGSGYVLAQAEDFIQLYAPSQIRAKLARYSPLH